MAKSIANRVADNPVVAGGTAVSAILALLVYYGILDVQGASLWGSLAVILLPGASSFVVRIFTMATHKIKDAGHDPEVISAKASVNRGDT